MDLVSTPIEGLKVIYAPTYRIDERATEDPIAYPFKLRAVFRHSEFMIVAAIGMYGGSEEFVIRAKTREAIEACITTNEWMDHPRLRSMVLTHPDGKEERLKPC